MTDIFDQYESLVNDQKWDEACELAHELTRIAPNVATSWFNLGVSLDETDRHFEAAIAFQRFLVMEPDDTGGVLRMLRSLLLADRTDALFEELRTYAYETPKLVRELATLDTFAELFRTQSQFARLLENDQSVADAKRPENFAALA